MKANKITAFMLMLMMIISLTAGMTACTPDSSTLATDGGPSATPAVTAADTATVETTASPQEMIELTFFTIYGLDHKLDEEWYETNPLEKKIREESGVIIRYQFPTVVAGDANDKLNLLLASGDYADIIQTDKQEILKRVIDEKIALPLEDLVEQNGPNIKESFGDILSRIKWEDGHQYYFPTNYGYSDPKTFKLGPGATFNIRQDIWLQAGSPAIDTLDDIYNYLVLLSEMFPTTPDGQKAYPMGGFVQAWQNMLETLVGNAGGYENQFYIDEDDQLSYWVRAPWAMTIIKFYNKIYREGLLDPESFTMDRSTWQKEKLGAQKCHTYMGNVWMGVVSEQALIEQGAEDAAWEPYPFTVPGAQTPKLISENPLGEKFLFVTDKCDSPDAAIRWVDALCDLNFEVSNGIEGGLWDFVDGIPKLHEYVVQEIQTGAEHPAWCRDYGCGMYNGFVFKLYGVSEWDTYITLMEDSNVVGTDRSRETDKRFENSDYYFDGTLLKTLYNGASEAQLQIKSTYTERLKNELYTAVLADSEDACVQAFEKFVADLDMLGLKDLEKLMNDNYQIAREKSE